MQLSVVDPATLTELAQTQGWLTTEQSILALSVAGEGNMNVVLRAQLQPTGSLIFKQSLPYVAKYPDIAAPIERVEAEYSFYRAIAESPARAQMPKLIGYLADQHLLCFEDLGAGQDYSFLYQRSPEHTIPTTELLTWLSTLHHLPVDPAETGANMDMRVLNHAHIFSIPFDLNNGLSFGTQLDQFRAGYLSENLLNQAAELGDIYLGRHSGEHAHCRLHGDFYPGSWLLHDSGEVKIIDPEFTFTGPAEFDVGVFLAHLLMCGESEQALQAHLSNYRPPPAFAPDLAWRFAGVEVMRRILGVAQLPLAADDPSKITLLETARDWTLGPGSLT